MSYELELELTAIIAHMQGLLDLKFDRTAALALVATTTASVNNAQAEFDADVARIERLEEATEQLSEKLQ